MPGTTFINAANEAEFPLPIVEGDRLTIVEEVVSVSPEKQTSSVSTLHRDRGHLHPSGRRSGRDKPEHPVPLHPGGGVVTRGGDDAERSDEEERRMMSWDQVSVPMELPEVRDEISYQRVVMNSGSSWDYFPGHFDPNYAENQGHPGNFREHHALGRLRRSHRDRLGRPMPAAWCAGR